MEHYLTSMLIISFSASTLLFGWQEEHLACKKSETSPNLE